MTALRRFPIVDGIAGGPLILDRTPDPWDTDETPSVVIDLVAADQG